MLWSGQTGKQCTSKKNYTDPGKKVRVEGPPPLSRHASFRINSGGTVRVRTRYFYCDQQSARKFVGKQFFLRRIRQVWMSPGC